jgi:hypothetical protein
MTLSHFFLFAATLAGSCCSVVAVSPPPVTAKVEFVGCEESQHKVTLYQFRVTNTSRVTLYYFGYSEHAPFLSVQKRSWFRWRDDGQGAWCGTGATYHALRPGRSFIFITSRGSRFWSWRVGVALYPKAEDSDPLMLWTAAQK